MQNKHRNADTKLSVRVHGYGYPNKVKQLPRPLRSACMGWLGNIARYLCKKFNQPNKCNIPNQPHQPHESNKCGESIYQHPCPNNPIRTCNCTNECADNDTDHRNPIPNKHGYFNCPTVNKPCHINTCPNGCKADKQHSEFQ